MQGGASETKRARVDSSAYLAKLLEEETKILPFKMVGRCLQPDVALRAARSVCGVGVCALVHRALS